MKNSSRRIRGIIFILSLLLLSYFYVYYKTVHSFHHCDESNNCHICITLSELLSHSPTPLAASLNKDIANFVPYSVNYLGVISVLSLFKETPVSLHIKKTE